MARRLSRRLPLLKRKSFDASVRRLNVSIVLILLFLSKRLFFKLLMIIIIMQIVSSEFSTYSKIIRDCILVLNYKMRYFCAASFFIIHRHIDCYGLKRYTYLLRYILGVRATETTTT